MTLQLYNTMTRKVEPFAPIAPPRVTLYTCGPTVWSYAHIGNFRTFLFEDLLRRWLEASGYEVFQVMNLTDVDDRIISEAGKAGTDIDAFVAPYIVAFNEDREWLRIRAAHAQPRATSFVPAMVRLVEGLLAKGRRLQGRGRLGLLLHRALPGVRPAVAARQARAPHRRERPGGERRVRQGGRARLRAVEGGAAGRTRRWARRGMRRSAAAGPAGISSARRWRSTSWARSSASTCSTSTPAAWTSSSRTTRTRSRRAAPITGQPDFARYWMHGEFLNIRGTKMSKRFGNYTTPRDLKADGVDAGAVRLLVFQTHYRQKLDLTDDALDGGARGCAAPGRVR